MNILNEEFSNLEAVGNKYANSYQTVHPFPHIYLDNFFNPEYLKKVLAEFPNLGDAKKDIYYENPNEKKHASKGDEKFGPTTKEFVAFLNSPEFRAFLNKLTGINEPLQADPYYEGGGFHQIKPGGFLKIHVDFHKHKILNLDRRLNLLVYLNEDWDESYGGHFELWEKDMSKAAVKILPLFNRVALFSTTGESWHGHPDPLTCPPERSRKSLALYYYTDGRPEEELTKDQSGRITTTFAARKGKDNKDMVIYNTVVNTMNKVLPDSVIRFIKKFRNT